MNPTAATLTSLLIAERTSLIQRAERILGNRSDAEEIAQTLWFKVQQIEDHPPILRKRAFLFRLLNNLAIDLHRSRSRQRQVHERVSELLSEADDRPGQDRIFDSAVILARVRQAAINLPEPTRTIFRLNRFEGLSQKAIAQRLGVSTTTVENHIRRALDALARARDGEDPV